MRVAGEPAFILHQRDYSETSLTLEVFTARHGRLGLLAKGARRPKSPWRGLLKPFQPLLLGWSGRGELGILTAAEPERASACVEGAAVFCGFYLNELLLRLLHRHDPHETLFDQYRRALEALACNDPQEDVLRVFEKHLLRELGYGLVFECVAPERAPLEPDAVYDYSLEHGPRRIGPETGALAGVRIHGASLMALAQERLDDARARREVKRLMRAALAPHLGDRPLHSRRLYQSMVAARSRHSQRSNAT